MRRAVAPDGAAFGVGDSTAAASLVAAVDGAAVERDVEVVRPNCPSAVAERVAELSNKPE
jgi:hypothetical protein